MDFIGFSTDADADADAENNKLFWAAKDGDASKVLDLIAGGASVNARTNKGRTPLHYASRNGHVAVVWALLDSGANVYAKTDQGVTPLHLASDSGHPAVVEKLIANGANIDATDNDGRTPRDFAASQEHAEVVSILDHAESKKENKKKNRKLLRAAKVGDASEALKLIADGANVHAKDNEGETPLHYATGNGHAAVVKALLASGANVHATNNYGGTPLHYASGSGHATAVKALLADGANVNAMTTKGNRFRLTPLHLASGNGHAAVVEALLAGGANVNGKDSYSWTPLHWASRSCHAAVVEALLASGANVNAEDNDQWTPHDVAASRGHAEVINILDPIAEKNTAGRGARRARSGKNRKLLRAAENGDASKARELIAGGVNVHATNKYGWTPLHLASNNGHAAVVEALLAGGADVHAKTADGRTPRSLAESHGHVEVLNLLGSALEGTDAFNNNATDNDTAEAGAATGNTAPGIRPEARGGASPGSGSADDISDREPARGKSPAQVDSSPSFLSSPLLSSLHQEGAGRRDRFRAKSNLEQLVFLKVGRKPARDGTNNIPVIAREDQSSLPYDEWVDLPDMSTARYGCAAAAIGEKLYAVGGCDQSRKHLATAEVLDSPTTDEWRKLPPMKIRRSGCAAAAAGGRLYVFGGNDGNRTMDTAERYDPKAGIWEALPKMPTARQHCGAVTVGGKIYVIGGRNNHDNALATMSVFDVTSQTWDGADLPHMQTSRYLCAAVVVDRFLVVVGGLDQYGFLLSSIEVFDTERWTWIGGCAEMKTANGACSASALSGRQLVVAGGLGRNTVETISLDELLPHKELMQVVTADLEKGRTSSLLVAIVESEGEGDDAAARRLQQMCDENDSVRDVVDRIRRATTRKEIIAATQEGGVCPLRRGRVTLVGRARSGKTSLLRALEGKGHDGAQKSTVGIDISDADVRDIGIDIRDMAAQEGLGEPWMAVDREKNTKEHAIRKQVAHLMDDVDTLRSSETKSESEALEDLLKKYGLGKELEEQKKKSSTASRFFL